MFFVALFMSFSLLSLCFWSCKFVFYIYFAVFLFCLSFFFLLLQVLCLHLFYYHFKIPICRFTSFGQRFDVTYVIGYKKPKLLEGREVVEVKGVSFEP
jgi:hypothetical protein